jgi:hypothetical protein
MMLSVIFVATLVVLVSVASAFSTSNMRQIVRSPGRLLKMEYIPDGMTKQQWEAMKKKEAEANKNKNLGAVGITKFQSRYSSSCYISSLIY